MKKLTASNDAEGSKPRAGPDMRSINVEDANKKPGIGSRFTKIGGGNTAGAGGGRFKKVGVAVSGAKEGYEDTQKEESAAKVVTVLAEDNTNPSVPEAVPEKQVETQQEDIVMADDAEEEDITWEEYDFTKPTGCDHKNCPGCKTDGIWGGTWASIGAT